MKWLSPKDWKPIFIEDSRVPGWLSKIAPLNIGAITIFFLVFSKGKINETTKRHETIHFQQTLEMFVVGLILLYVWDWLHGLIKYRNNWDEARDLKGKRYTSLGNKAYYRIRAEQEAYACQRFEHYLSNRKRYRWIMRYKV